MILPRRIIGLVLAVLPLAVLAQPRSAEELISTTRKAIEEKNPEKFNALFYTKGMSDSDKQMATNHLQRLFQPVEAVSIAPFPAGFRSTHIMQGKKIEATYPPVGVVEIKFAAKQGMTSSSIPYAIIDQHYFLVSSKTTDLGWKGPPDKQMGWTVYGKGREKVQVHAEWNASGVDQKYDFKEPDAFFWAQYIKKVTVTSTDEDAEVTLTVREDGKPIFESEPLKGKGTMEYKRKS